MSILIGIMAIIVILAVAPSIEELAIDTAGPDTFNCAADVDYNSTRDTNTLGCTVTALVSPLLILGVIIAVIMSIMYGRPEEQPQYTVGY